MSSDAADPDSNLIDGHDIPERVAVLLHRAADPDSNLIDGHLSAAHYITAVDAADPDSNLIDGH